MTKSDRQQPADPEDALFPQSLTIAPADAVATYQLTIGRFNAVGYLESMLDAHSRSIATPELARLFRTREAIEDVEQAAASLAPRLARDPASAGADAISRYKRGIAEQLAATTGHELQRAARAYLAACEAREVAAAEQREQAERERAERERAAAAERAAKKAEAGRAAAELEHAAAEASTLEARLRATREEHRRLRLMYFTAACRQLQDSGVSTIRLKSGFSAMFGRGAYAVADLIAQAPNLTDETLAQFERVVGDELERLEDAET